VWDDPELALRVEDDGDGFEACGSDGPAAGEDFDGVIVCAAALEVNGEVQVAERRERRGCELGSLFIEGELPGVVGDEAGGAAGTVGVVPGDLLGEEGVGGREVGDGRGTEQRDEAVLEGAKAAFDFPLGLRVRGDAVGDAQAEQGALKLGADIVGAGARGWRRRGRGGRCSRRAGCRGW